MEKEDKDLLLKDLCGRLPYGVKCAVYGDTKIRKLSGIVYEGSNRELYFEELDWKECDGFEAAEYCKPYLFPFSSMTEEQKKEWLSLMIRDSYGILYHTIESFDYLYKNHIDIRGLIPMGLALDATNLNIY